MKRIVMITAMILLACMIPAAIYAAQNQVNPENDAQKIALRYLKTSPTFAFDGMADTLKVVKVSNVEDDATSYKVELTFESLHGGYGNRATSMMTQAITPHTVTVEVVDGEVTGMIIDDQWDEVSQDLVRRPMPPLIMPISTEEAKNAAVEYIISTYNTDFQLPVEWEYINLTPEGLLGSTTIEYSGAGWKVTLTSAVVMRPVYSVEVEYTREGSFTWSGSVDSEGNVMETSTTLTSTPIEPSPTNFFGIEDARNMVVQYIKEKHSDLKITAPVEWIEKNLSGEVLGYTKINFSADGWSITLEGPVVWKPDYEVEATYSGTESFTWKGIVPNGGPVQELDFIK